MRVDIGNWLFIAASVLSIIASAMVIYSILMMI